MRLLLAFCLSLLAACSVAPPVVKSEPSQPSTVIIVHGLFANANHVRPLRVALESQGHRCLSPNLVPNDGSLSIEQLADQLATFVARNVPADAPQQFIGHSMGGLVALQYLQDPRAASRCRGLYTIATPHNGTLLAAFHGGQAGRQMSSGSPFLKRLHARRPPFPVTTFRSTKDLVILPNSSSTLPFAENHLIESNSHNAILQSPRLHSHIGQRIRTRDGLDSW